jgi:methylenetetrahydrofolate reductase (NADPH)
VATLVRFAIRCGVTNSIRALTGRADRFLRLVSDSAPDGLVRGLAESDPALLAGVAGLHFFPFGGVAKTARWANALKRGRFRANASGGLDVEL